MAEHPSHSFEMTPEQQQNNLYLLIHTMTITESDCIVQAQFFHTFVDCNIDNATLVARRMRLKFHPGLGTSRGKLNFQRLNPPNLRRIMKRNSANIKHHLRAVRMYVSRHTSNICYLFFCDSIRKRCLLAYL